MALKLITAGESHGPGLTCIVEGLPAGLELDREAIDRDMARRQLGHGRGGRMKIETRPRGGHRGRAPRAHARRADRAAGRQPRLRQLGGADEPVAGRGRGAGGPSAAARPRRPRRRLEVRLHATCATCSSAPARARRPRASPAARWPRPSCARSASRSARTSSRSAPSARAERDAPLTRRGLRGASTTTRCAAWTRDASRAMVEHINVQRKANESIGGVFEVIAFGLVPGPRLARLLGGAPRRAPGAGDLLDPGGQGRRRSATASTSPRARLARPTTRSSTATSAATTARPTAPAASRAA